MKIVYCISGLFNSGGMERVLTNKVNYLVSVGVDVIVVTTDQRGRKPFFPISQEVELYDLAINYDSNNGRNFLNKICCYPVKQWKHRKRLKKLLLNVKPDIVISMFCNDVSFIAGIKDGSKKVLEIHFSRFKRLQYNRKGLWRLTDLWRSRLDMCWVKKFDRFVVLTSEDCEDWGNLSNIIVIPNAKTSFKDSKATLQNKKAIAVGRYTYQKGFDMLLTAWKTVSMSHPDWQLELIGNGELREELMSQIETLGLKEVVNLKNATTDILSEYVNASLLVMPSRYEGLPMVLLEAMSVGLPVVAFECKCGPKDIIENGVNGVLVSPNDVEELGLRIIQMIDSPSMRKKIGCKAVERSQSYTQECIMARWIDLFKTLLEKKG